MKEEYKCPVCDKVIEGPIPDIKLKYRCSRCQKTILSEYKKIKK